MTGITHMCALYLMVLLSYDRKKAKLTFRISLIYFLLLCKCLVKQFEVVKLKVMIEVNLFKLKPK